MFVGFGNIKWVMGKLFYSDCHNIHPIAKKIWKMSKNLLFICEIMFFQHLSSSDWTSLTREQINARRTVMQLKSYIQQLDQLRLQVSY